MGFVILTTPNLKIKEILYNDTEFLKFNKDRLVTSYASKEDRTKLLDFARNIENEKAEFGYEIHMKSNGETELYNFSGIKVEEDGILILASKLKEDIINQYDHFMKINNQYVNEIRRLLKNQIKTQNETIITDDDTDLYNQMSQINNELMNVQRELTKTNEELKWQKEKYFATLKSIGEGVIALQDNQKIQFINKAAYNILGIKEDIKDDSFTEKNIKCFDDNENNILQDILDTVFKKGHTIKKEDVLLVTDNKKTPIDLTVSPIEVSDGKIIGIVIVISDITLKKKHEEKLRKMAVTDQLTGITNRRMGIKYLENQIERVKREDIPLTVSYIDVNGLKNINDNYGHTEGDYLLKNVAEIFTNNIRATDIVSRLGGDEFLIIFSDCNRKNACEIWERIEKGIEKWNNNINKPYKISLSYGFAQKKKGDGRTVEELIDRADKKMYEQKEKYYNNK